MAINTIAALQTRLKQINTSIGQYLQNQNFSSQQMPELQTLYDEQKVLLEDFAKLIKDRDERQKPQPQPQPQQQHGNK